MGTAWLVAPPIPSIHILVRTPVRTVLGRACCPGGPPGLGLRHRRHREPEPAGAGWPSSLEPWQLAAHAEIQAAGGNLVGECMGAKLLKVT